MVMQRFAMHSSDPDDANRALVTLFDSPIDTTAEPGRDFEVDARASLSPEFSWLELGFITRGGRPRRR